MSLPQASRRSLALKLTSQLRLALLLRWINCWVLIVLLCLGNQTVRGTVPLSHSHQATIDNMMQRIETEKKRHTILLKRAAHIKNKHKTELKRISHEMIEKHFIDKAYFDYSLSLSEVSTAQQLQEEGQAELEDLKRVLKRNKIYYQDRLLKLKEDTNNSSFKRLEQNLISLNTLIQQNESWLALLNDSVRFTTKISELQHLFYQQIVQEYSNQQDELRESYIASLNQRHQAAQAKWLSQINQLTNQLDTTDLSRGKQNQLELQIFQAEAKIALAGYDLKIAAYADELKEIRSHLIKTDSVQDLDSQMRRLTPLKNALLALEKKIKKKQYQLNVKQSIQVRYLAEKLINKVNYDANLNLIQNLNQHYLDRSQGLERVQNDLQSVTNSAAKKMAEAISSRQALPGTDWQAWLKLLHSFVMIPKQSIELVTNLYQHVLLSYNRSIWLMIIMATFVLPLFGIVGLSLKYSCDQLLARLAQTKERVTLNFLQLVLQILRRNLLGIYLITSTVIYLYWMEVSFDYYAFIVQLGLVWFTYRAILQCARLCLVETITDVSGNDVRLFKRLSRTLMIGSAITTIAVLAKLLKVPHETQDLISRLLMLFMFAVAAVLLWSNEILLHVLKRVIDTKHLYLLRTIDLLSILLPVNVLMIAVLGLIGYVQLAWRSSYYQMMFLLVVTFYTIARGILNDVMEFLASYVIRVMRHGWLLTEAFLKPFDRLLHFLLISLSMLILFYFFGWNKDPFVMDNLENILYYPFITFKGGQISLMSVFEFALMLMLLIWTTRWAYEFSYRLIFSNIRDLGLKKSLALFFQYSVGILGIIPTLWILGIDLAGFGIILSALAIGLGFGLRDFANNIVSGLLLLIERPIKEGDLVSIGGYEGRVTSVGLRSMTVRSWDHMEVMVPNSEAFNKSFLNWTYDNGIVRSIIMIKIHRQDDPTYVQSILLDVLDHIEEVVAEPEPRALLKELDDALVEFEIRYFIDINLYSRVNTRSKVLFAIWQRFKSCGIRPPYSQQDIKIIEHART